MQRVVSWFSCGAASAYATYLASQKYDDLQIVYCRVRQEHPSNMQFIKDFQRKTNLSVQIIENEKFEGDIFNVFLKRQFIKSSHGAPCTLVLKKEMRKAYQLPDDIQIFGYTAEEEERRNSFIDSNPEVILDDILINNRITKKQCLDWLLERGFELPVMYKLGYDHNNCIGCVKGGMGYWNAIRKDFPEAFNKMAVLERTIGHSICKTTKKSNGKEISIPVYLDELHPKRGNFKRDQPPACGFNCEWGEYDYRKK